MASGPERTFGSRSLVVQISKGLTDGVLKTRRTAFDFRQNRRWQTRPRASALKKAAGPEAQLHADIIFRGKIAGFRETRLVKIFMRDACNIWAGRRVACGTQSRDAAGVACCWLREEKSVAFPLMVSFAVIMSAVVWPKTQTIRCRVR